MEQAAVPGAHHRPITPPGHSTLCAAAATTLVARPARRHTPQRAGEQTAPSVSGSEGAEFAVRTEHVPLSAPRNLRSCVSLWVARWGSCAVFCRGHI